MENPNSVNNFMVRNPQDWKRLVDQLFPVALPKKARWTDPAAIVEVLQHIGAVNNSNYTLLPESGGLELTGAKLAGAPGFVDLYMDASVRACKPTELTFESFGDAQDYQWNYFRLELETVAPLGKDAVGMKGYGEIVTEVAPGEYDNYSRWQSRSDDDEDALPATARPVVRLLKGSLVIFQKSSIFNLHLSKADGAHDQMTAQEFRDDMELMQRKIKHELGLNTR